MVGSETLKRLEQADSWNANFGCEKPKKLKMHTTSALRFTCAKVCMLRFAAKVYLLKVHHGALSESGDATAADLTSS